MCTGADEAEFVKVCVNYVRVNCDVYKALKGKPRRLYLSTHCLFKTHRWSASSAVFRQKIQIMILGRVLMSTLIVLKKLD